MQVNNRAAFITNHESSQLQVRGLVFGDRVDLYRFKVTRDSAVHFVAFFAPAARGEREGKRALHVWGLAGSGGLDGLCIILRNMRAFRFARRAWVL